MGKVWQLAGLTRPERDVLLALADHAHDDGSSARPGVPYLMWKIDLSKSTVHAALRGLEGKRLIEPTAAGGGRGVVTEYQLRLENGTGKRPFSHVNGTISGSETVRSSLARLDEPSLVEPSITPSLSVSADPAAAVVAAWTAHAPPLIVHRPEYLAADRVRRKIAAAVKVYPAADVAKAIANYATVLGPGYRWSYKWTLLDFLQRGLDKFVDEALPLRNYRDGFSPTPGQFDDIDELG